MHIDEWHYEGITLLEVQDAVVFVNGEFRKKVEDALAEGRRQFVFNLRKIYIMDPDDLATLTWAIRNIGRAEGFVRLMVRPKVETALGIIFMRPYEVYSDIGEAIESCVGT